MPILAALKRPFQALRARPEVVAIGFLALLPFVFMWDFVLGRSYLDYLDFTLQWLPWQKFVDESLRHGEAPFWNPYLMLGFSQVGESQVGIFYPVNLLTSFLELHWRFGFIVCLHLALANVSMYWLLRYFDLRRIPALIGAVTYGLSGYMVAQITNYVLTENSAYLPLMIFLLAKYLESRRPVLLAWFSLVVGLNLLISHAGTTFLLLAGCSIFFVAAAARSGHFKRDVLWYGGALVLASLFAAVQVLPTLELRPLSERGGGLSISRILDPRFMVGFEDRLSFFFPWMLGTPRGGRTLARGYEESHQYAGAFTPVLAVVALLHWKDLTARKKWFFSSIMAVGLVAAGLSLGAKFPFVNPWLLLARLPLFSMFRLPARWGCLATFALSVAAAFGVDALIAKRARTRTLVVLSVVLPALAVAAAVLQEGAHKVLPVFAAPLPILATASNGFERLIIEPLSRVNPVVLYSLLVVPCLLIHWIYRKGWWSSARFQAVLLTLLIVDLFVVESPTNPRSPDHAFFDVDHRGKFFEGNKRYCRLATTERRVRRVKGFPYNLAAYFGIFTTAGDTPLEYRPYMQIEDQLGRADLFDYLGACYEIKRNAISPRPHAAPRAFLVRDIRPTTGQDPLDAFLALHGKEMQQVAYLAPRDFAAARELEHGSKAPPKQKVVISRYENSVVELSVRTSEPGLLVLTDMNYPGWHAELDDRIVRVLSAEGAFRSVVVPAGSHTVRFTFRPLSVYLGASISGLSLLGFAGFLLWQRRRDRRSSATAR